MLSFFGVRDYVYGGIILFLSISLLFLKLSYNSLEVDKVNLEKTVASYDTVIAEAQHDKEIKQIEVLKEIQVVKKDVETKIKKVKEFVRDENKSDCTNAMDFARVTF